MPLPSVKLDASADALEQLRAINQMAQSSKLTTGGRIGLLGDRVVKFNTGWKDRWFGPSQTPEMLESCNNLRERMGHLLDKVLRGDEWKKLRETLKSKIGEVTSKGLLDRSIVASVIDAVEKAKGTSLKASAETLAALSSDGNDMSFAAVEKDFDENLVMADFNEAEATFKVKYDKVTARVKNQGGVDNRNEADQLLGERVNDAIENDGYCKIEGTKDYHIVSCGSVQTDDIDKFGNASTELKLNIMAGQYDDVVEARRRECKLANVEMKPVFCSPADQHRAAGYLKEGGRRPWQSGMKTGLEESLLRRGHPGTLCHMKANGYIENDRKDATAYWYANKSNGLPKFDVVHRTLIDFTLDCTHNGKLEEPIGGRLLFGSAPSLSPEPVNFDRAGNTLFALTFHREVDKAREERPLTTTYDEDAAIGSKFINRFLDRQENAKKKSTNIGGLTKDQYHQAVKLMLFKFDLYKKRTDKELDQAIDELVETAKQSDSRDLKEAHANYLKTMHHVVGLGYSQIAKEDSTDYFATLYGGNAFDNNVADIADIDTYEFLLHCKGKTYNYCQYDTHCPGNPKVPEELKTEAQLVRDSMERNLKKIQQDKTVYTEELRTRLRDSGITEFEGKPLDDLSYEELVKLEKARKNAYEPQPFVRPRTVSDWGVS